jgi:hypothetical protein
MHKLVLQTWETVNGRETLSTFEKEFRTLAEAVLFLDTSVSVYDVAKVYLGEQVRHERHRHHHPHHDFS